MSVYLIALGYGGYQPNIATFGADQFDAEDSVEKNSKIAFFSYFYLALNVGSLFSNTVFGYFGDKGKWPLGFWASAGSAFAGLVIFLTGTPKYRHFMPRESPWSRFCQVWVSAARKAKIDVDYEELNLYDSETLKTGDKKILHTKGFRSLDRAAIVTPDDEAEKVQRESKYDPWRLCSVTQVEEVKCVLRRRCRNHL